MINYIPEKIRLASVDKNKLKITRSCLFQELNTWSLKLANDLVRFKGRQLAPENIVQGGGNKYPAGDTTEGWTRDMRLVIIRSLTSLDCLLLYLYFL